MAVTNRAMGSTLLPSPLRGWVGGGGAKRIDLSWGPPSLTLPRRKSGLPDLRKLKICNRGKPQLRGGGNGDTVP
jgi:hypothetical protein